MEVAADLAGRIFSLAHSPKLIPPKNVILEDFIVILDSAGKELRRVSLYEAIANSEYSGWIDPARGGDSFHTNTIEVLDGRAHSYSPHFRKGNVLVSLYELDALAVVDMHTQKVVWGLRGAFSRQHQPMVLENGNLLLFDNQGGKPEHSRVLEISIATGEIVWSYEADEPGAFYTFCCGTSQRLPNGNTLITDTAGGTAFEVTPSKEIVWQYRSPFRARSNPDFVASLWEVVRLPSDFPIAWAKGRAAPRK